MTENNAIPLRTRTIGVIHPEQGGMIGVDHVYAPDGAVACDDCGKPAHDPGMVGLLVAEGYEDDDGTVCLMLEVPEALELVNRLTRAVNAILESGEDAPDVEREIARLSAGAAPDAG